MSRNLTPKSGVSISDQERSLRKTEDGKLIYTTYRNRKSVFLLRNNRLVAAYFPENSKIGSVYIAKVKHVTKSIDACFVEIQGGEICFLSFKEAVCPLLLNRGYDGRILEGDEILVQVTRDAQKNKQPSVTAQISLSNDYFVLSLGSEKTGYSAKLDGKQKSALAKRLAENGILENGRLTQDIFRGAGVDPSVGLIVRTKALELLEDASSLALPQSFFRLAETFERLLRDALHRTCFSCLYAEDKLLSGMSNFSYDEYGEIVTDDEALYGRLREYTSTHTPKKPVRLYQDRMLSLNSLYSLESKMDAALSERVWLKSGGYLVIQPTEALTVIDVNSGKYETGNRTEEETSFRINAEAAEEIALQLRLRNLSGIIIVDFINMAAEEHRRDILDCLKKYVQGDRVRTTVVDMTPLGLVEITRKKTTRSLREQLHGNS